MTKILIADLFGTLIPISILSADYLYGKETKRKNWDNNWTDSDYYWELLDDIFVHLGRDLTPFLEEGNYLKIVSSLDGHEPIDFTLDTIIPRLYKNLNNYKSQIDLFLNFEKCKEFDPKKFKKTLEQYQENGLTYYKYNNDFVFRIIQNKSDIWDGIKERYDIEKDKIYCIGDSEKDLSMLVKCIGLGGTSCLIKNNLWTNDLLSDKSTDDIIFDKASMDYCLMMEQEILKLCPDYSKLDWKKRREIRLNLYGMHENDRKAWFRAREKELYEQLNAGNLDIYGLFKDKIVYDMISFHYDRYLEMKTFSENQGDKLMLYPTYREFSNKVLMKKQGKN